MGYSTDFNGSISVSPPMDESLIEFLNKFATTRRMKRAKGPDYVDGTGFNGQDHEADVIDYNAPPEGQPSLWCQWVPSEDGTEIEWDGGEKFYQAPLWMAYIIHHYIAPKGHTCNGSIDAFGEESDDIWRIIVTDNEVTTQKGEITYKDAGS